MGGKCQTPIAAVQIMGLHATIGTTRENVNGADAGVRAYEFKGADIGCRSLLLRGPSGNRDGKLQ